MHAVLGLHVVRLSVCDVDGSGVHSLEILEANCTNNLPNTFALRSAKAIHLLPGEHVVILGRLEVGWGKTSVLEQKSGNISETRKDRRKVIMKGPIGSHQLSFERYLLRPHTASSSSRLGVRNPTQNSNRYYLRNG